VLALLGGKASQELKNLIENKHLYQKVDISPTDILATEVKNENHSGEKENLIRWGKEELPRDRFALAQSQLFTASRATAELPPILTLALCHLSLFCKHCGRREAFAPAWYRDVSNEIRVAVASGASKHITLPDGFQMFFLVYQCQHCLGTPEGFLVRRDGWTLSLHGRSPIEWVELPSHIPKDESKHYRDALIAFNSGKLLAALFYLRTFVEQFARRLTGLTGRVMGEEILDAYYAKLPSPTKDQMPSLREWHDKLSEALHAAREDAPLFETGKAAIDKHFEIRKVFGIPETQTPTNAL